MVIKFLSSGNNIEQNKEYINNLPYVCLVFPCIVFTCISVWDKLAEPWGTHSKETLVIPLAVCTKN